MKEIGLESLVMPMEGWKLNSTIPLIYPSQDGYPRAWKLINNYNNICKRKENKINITTIYKKIKEEIKFKKI